MSQLIVGLDGVPRIRQAPGVSPPATPETVASTESVRVVLRFVVGDKVTPTKTIDLSEKLDQGGRVLLLDPRTQVGFVPRSGSEEILWTDPSYRRPLSGQNRVTSRRNNATLEIAYVLYKQNVGGRAAIQELQRVQDAISEVSDLVKSYEEDGRGEPVYLEFRVGYGLGGLLQPTVGQLSHFWRVKAVNPQWPDNYLSRHIKHGLVIGAQSNVIGSPVAEGVRDQVGLAYGPVEDTQFGMLLNGASRNFFVNPDFTGNDSVAWDNSWFIQSSTLIATQETRPANTGNNNTGVRLTNSDTGNSQYYGQTVTITPASGSFVSCVVANPDGSAVTSQDVALYIANTTVEADGIVQLTDRKYLVYAEGSTGVGTYGVVVKSGTQIIVSQMMLQTQNAGVVYPYIDGDSLGSEWFIPGSKPVTQTVVKTAVTGIWEKPLTDQMAGNYSLSMWVTPLYASGSITEEFNILQYLATGDNLRVSMLSTPSIQIERDSVTVATFPLSGFSFSTTPYTPFHLVLIQTASAMQIFINGSHIGNATNAAGLPADGQLFFYHSHIFDGLRVFPNQLSDEEVATIYANELPIKTERKPVQPIPFKWIDQADGNLNTYSYKDASIGDESSDGTNVAVVSGVPGDTEAEADYEITYTPGTQHNLWSLFLGRISSEIPINAWEWLFMNLDGVSTSITNTVGLPRSFKAASTTSGTTKWFEGSFGKNAVSALKGRFLMIAGFNGDPPANWSGDPYSHYNALSTDHYYYYPAQLVGRSTGPSSGTANNAEKVGEVFIKPPADYEPAAIHLGVRNKPRGGSGATWNYADWLCLVPAPYAAIEILDTATDNLTIEADAKLVIKNFQASVLGNTTKREYRRYALKGEPPGVRPGQYNYLVFCAIASAAGLSLTDTYNLEVFITPRKLLPGGTM